MSNQQIHLRTTWLLLSLSFVFLLCPGIAKAQDLPSTRISLISNTVTVGQFFSEIESQAKCLVVYSEANIQPNASMTFSRKEGALPVLVNEFAMRFGLNYRFSNGYLTFTKAQQTPQQKPAGPRTVKGYVTDANGDPLPGATVQVAGTDKGVLTNIDGSYEIKVSPTDELVYSFIGMQPQSIKATERTILNVELSDGKDQLEDAVVVAFGTQRKESVIGAITTVKPAELKVPSSNLTTALAGRVAGLISYQRTGEPGQDDASFFVRGVTSLTYAKGPMILIDGVEMSSSDLARIQPDDIESFSIMKDATATAVYGARGANGVILVNTKSGQEGPVSVKFRYETSISQPTRELELADPITYMELANEAAQTRDRLADLPYSQVKIESTKMGLDPVMFPSVDWSSLLLKNSTVNHRFNTNFSGGGKVARYYVAASFTQDNGLLKVDKRNNFNNNIDLKKYVLHSNVDINVTKTTKAAIRLHASFDDYNGPLKGGSETYSMIMNTSPVLYLPYYEPDKNNLDTQHILFGNYDDGSYLNPYAELVRGYREYNKSTMHAQFELKQDLSFITKGLRIRGLASTTRYAFFESNRHYNPFWYVIGGYDNRTKEYTLRCLNSTTGTEYLSFSQGGKTVTATNNFEAALNYDRIFGKKHGVSGLLVGTARNYMNGNAGSLIASLPHRNLGLAGRFTYNYDKRYFLEFNFGYNGSERFARNERFGFFPSGGVSWIVSNEKFYSDSMKKFIDKLKFKATYGLVGNDAIGGDSQRFFYLSQVNMNDSSVSNKFGLEFLHIINGVTVSKYANDKITWERSYKFNLGMEAQLFKMATLELDYYTERRTGILQTRSYIPDEMGLVTIPMSNVGEAMARGFDASLDVSKSFPSGYWISGRANFTYGTTWWTKYEDWDKTDYPWLSHIGQPVSQGWGYIAERLFVDEEEVANSPVQFGDYMAGDIKYRDVDRDGTITDKDVVPIGFPTEPEIIYGFGISTGFKGFDFSVFFQGLARESFWISVENTSPFVNSGGRVKQLLKAYADDHWDENNRNIYALWPRLSPKVVSNNSQPNTWFMRDGSFLRLKSLEFGYTVPRKITGKIHVSNFRVYFSGTNLLTFSRFNLWDIEQAGNAFNYPIQKVFNFGAQLSF